MLFPSGLSYECQHFALTPSIIIEPTNGDFCVFMRWGSLEWSGEVSVNRFIYKGFCKLQELSNKMAITLVKKLCKDYEVI